jgi:hypothetical protein
LNPIHDEFELSQGHFLSITSIDGSEFARARLNYLSIETVHDRSVLEKQCLIDIMAHRLIWCSSI